MNNKLKYPVSQKPEFDRLIKAEGCDWTWFTTTGKFIPYKKGSPKKLNGKARFCRFDPSINKFVSDRETWKSVETWEYID